MSHRDILCSAIQKVAWGYIFLHLNFNLSINSAALNLIPSWAGYILMCVALPLLGEELPSIRLLRPLGILLGLWEGFHWILDLFSVSPDLDGWSIIPVVLGLYFHFQLLTDLASLSGRYSCPETARILKLRTVRTLLITIQSLPLVWNWLLTVSTTTAETLTVILLTTHLVVAFWICSILFSLRRSLMQEDPGQPEQP